MDDIATQTIHHFEDVFLPGSLPGVRSFLTAERIFDIALIKLGSSALLSHQSMTFVKPSDQNVNHCHEENPEKCWEIKSATLATKETRINIKGRPQSRKKFDI